MKKEQKKMMQTENKAEIIVDDDRWNVEGKKAQDATQGIFALAVDYLKENSELEFLPRPMPLSINICLSNDEEVHKLNKEFRNMDKPTNVLSFAHIDDDAFSEELENADIAELGDIIISLDTLEREAKIENISFENHYAHLLVHGILHLCGFDHIEEEEAEYMESTEIAILKKMNIENPYKDYE